MHLQLRLGEALRYLGDQLAELIRVVCLLLDLSDKLAKLV